MAGQIRHDFIYQRPDGTAPAIHDALTADLHDVHPGEDRQVGCRLGGLLQRGVAQRSADETLPEFAQMRVR
jgi:hypothetical protein